MSALVKMPARKGGPPSSSLLAGWVKYLNVVQNAGTQGAKGLRYANALTFRAADVENDSALNALKSQQFLRTSSTVPPISGVLRDPQLHHYCLPARLPACRLTFLRFLLLYRLAQHASDSQWR